MCLVVVSVFVGVLVGLFVGYIDLWLNHVQDIYASYFQHFAGFLQVLPLHLDSFPRYYFFEILGQTVDCLLTVAFPKEYSLEVGHSIAVDYLTNRGWYMWGGRYCGATRQIVWYQWVLEVIGFDLLVGHFGLCLNIRSLF